MCSKIMNFVIIIVITVIIVFLAVVAIMVTPLCFLKTQQVLRSICRNVSTYFIV
jgi:hypothetical protein